MIIHDISVTATPSTVTWEGTEQGHAVTWLAEIGPASVAALSAQSFGSHTGTHLDAPRHFIPGGRTTDQIDINALVGPAELVEIAGNSVSVEELEKADLPIDTRRLLFKTSNTHRRLLADPQFHNDYVGIDPAAAQWMVDRGIVLVGIDYLSIGPYGSANIDTHRILLGAGVVAVEGLLLSDVAPGRYFLAALPPKFAGVEGMPCRVILIEGLHAGGG